MRLLWVFFGAIFALSVLASTNRAEAAVWETVRDWDSEWELKYSEWVKSEVIHREIFSSPDSPYYGIAVDCADLILAVRTIFSAKHGLPFTLGISEAVVVTNQESWFDGIEDPNRRLRAFIDYFLDDSGTDQLAKLNSYPVNPSNLRPGDIYITQWQRDDGKMVGHGHLIKDILPTGNLHLLYSTTPKAPRILLERLGMPRRLPISDSTAWGFRRLRTPEQIKMRVEQIDHFSRRQYELLNNSPTTFFDQIRDILKMEDEKIGEKIRRQAKNLCGQLVQRVSLVDLAIEQLTFRGQRTASRQEYQLYSTPALDRSIFDGIKSLIKSFNQAGGNSRNMVSLVGPDQSISDANQHEQKELDQSLTLALNYLKGVERSNRSRSALNDLCQVPIAEDSYFNLRDFFYRYSKKRLSPNPNHSWSKRWGITTR
jgi:hypothetical protein